MPNLSDLSGKQFADLTVIKLSHRESGKIYWQCRCRCGTEKSIDGAKLRSGHTRSCGCLQRKWVKEGQVTHGMTGTPTYYTWKSVKARCTNPNRKDYQRYGARGITICDKWLAFDGFLEDMGERPEGATLDRIDNDGNYCKENCRWADWATQNYNKGIRSHNSSGVTGVRWNERDKAWIAEGKKDGERSYLYYGKSKEEAINARKQWEAEKFPDGEGR